MKIYTTLRSAVMEQSKIVPLFEINNKVSDIRGLYGIHFEHLYLLFAIPRTEMTSAWRVACEYSSISV